jgi:hypothetical protein
MSTPYQYQPPSTSFKAFAVGLLAVREAVEFAFVTRLKVKGVKERRR